MVVVRCLILCSKFTKNRLSARTRWGAYSASSDPLAGSLGRERKGEMEGQEGEGKGEEGASEKEGGEGRGREGKGRKGIPSE